jgi:O-antigen/teichoic acid export membrane protein
VSPTTPNVTGALRRAAFIGVGWTTIQTTGSRAISAAVFVLLARLLEPAAFGLVSLATVFVTFIQIFVEQGFGRAIVQRENLTKSHLDTAFWLSMAIGVCLTLFGIAIANPIAQLMREPSLAPVLRALSPTLFITGLASVPEAVLMRRLAFRSLALRMLAGIAVGGAVAVASAFAGFGVWSLVLQLLTQATVSTVVLWLAVPWRPGIEITRAALADLIGFGSSVVGIELLNFVNRQSDNFLIGAVLGPTALGYYSVGYRILLLLTDVLTRTIDAVTLPTFSRVQQEIPRLRRAYLMATGISSTVATPIYLLVAALAPSIIHGVFGAKWDPAIPVMQILAFIGLLHANLFFNTSVLLAVGQPRKALFLTGISAFSNFFAFAIAVHWGIVAVATAYVIRGYLFSPLPVSFVKHILGFSWSEYLPLPFTPVLCSIPMLFSIGGIELLVGNRMPPLLALPILFSTGLILYGLTLRIAAYSFLERAIEFIQPVFPGVARLLLWPRRPTPISQSNG